MNTETSIIQNSISESSTLYTIAKMLGIVKDSIDWKQFKIDPYNMEYLFINDQDEFVADFLSGIKPCFSNGHTFIKFFNHFNQRVKLFNKDELVEGLYPVMTRTYSHFALSLACTAVIHNRITQNDTQYTLNDMANVCQQLSTLESVVNNPVYVFEWSQGVDLSTTSLKIGTISNVDRILQHCNHPLLKDICTKEALNGYLDKNPKASAYDIGLYLTWELLKDIRKHTTEGSH